MRKGYGVAVIVLACLVAFQSHGLSVFSENFESGIIPGEMSGGSTVFTQGYLAYGFGEILLQNTSGGNPAAAITLTLTGLPAHTSINLDFFFAAINSWDGSVTSIAPDFFNVHVDGVEIFSHTFDHQTTADSSYYGGGTPASVLLDASDGLNVFDGSYVDSAYDMSLDTTFQNIAHTSSTLRVEWFASGGGWQGEGDESVGLDNIEVTLNGLEEPVIPEPASMALLGLGTAVLGLKTRMRKKR